MPVRQSSGAVPSFTGKPRYPYKPYYRRSNPNSANQSSRQKGASSSNPEPQRKRTKPTARSHSDAKGTIPPCDSTAANSYSGRRKPSVGIFGAERATKNLTLQRRLDGIKPKGIVPPWLSETFGHLPHRHPLSTRVADLPENDPAAQDDDNPFAFHPPSPTPTLLLADHTPSVPSLTQRRPPDPHAFQRRTHLSSIPFAPPTFIEPTYEDCYQDTLLPLNDEEHMFDRENPAYWTADDEPFDQITSTGPPILQVSTPIPRFPSPQQIPSPLFLSDVYPPSGTPAFNPAFPDNTSSDDFALPTPTHNAIDFVTPRKDQIKDVLQNKHSFVTSVYASSPAESFRGFPLDALLGSRDSSPFAHSNPSSATDLGAPQTNLASVPRFRPVQKLAGNAHTSTRPPASPDIYKAKLLAYATAVVDQMNSSGDEGSAYGSWMGAEPSSEPPESRPTTGVDIFTPQAAGYATDERFKVPDFSGYDLGGTRTVTQGSFVAQDGLDGDLTRRANLMGVDQRPARTLDIIPETNSKPISPEDHLLDADLEGLNPADTGLFEDWENESAEDNLESGDLASNDQLMQAEFDALAADEPSDEEMEPVTEPTDLAQIGAEVEYSVPRPADVTTASKLEPSKPTPKIRPFPMTVSRRVSDHDPTPNAAGVSETKLTRLSPKFTPRPVKSFRPNPFAALLKRRFGAEGTPEVDEEKVQGRSRELEDDIESWPG